jgi:hypothetical protein
VNLADHTTLHLGGPARRFVRAGTEADLIEAVRAADGAGEPMLILGGGSNLVVADRGFDGTVIQVATTGVHQGGGSGGSSPPSQHWIEAVWLLPGRPGSARPGNPGPCRPSPRRYGVGTRAQLSPGASAQW